MEDPDWQSAGDGKAELTENMEDVQTGKVLSTLAEEFGSDSSPDELAALVSGMQQLLNAGLLVQDIADAMYGLPGVPKALKDGDPEAAKEMLVPPLKTSLSELRASGVAENLLRFLSVSGFGAVELASALRNKPHLRDDLRDGAAADTKKLLSELHEYLRNNGRPTHSDASQMDENPTLEWSGAPGSWFDQYLNRIRGAEEQHLRATRWEDATEIVLPLLSATPTRTSGGRMSDWIIGGLLVIAIVVIAASHYC
jgi:hypothetical protein